MFKKQIKRYRAFYVLAFFIGTIGQLERFLNSEIYGSMLVGCAIMMVLFTHLFISLSCYNQINIELFKDLKAELSNDSVEKYIDDFRARR